MKTKTNSMLVCLFDFFSLSILFYLFKAQAELFLVKTLIILKTCHICFEKAVKTKNLEYHKTHPLAHCQLGYSKNKSENNFHTCCKWTLCFTVWDARYPELPWPVNTGAVDVIMTG